LTGRGAKPLLRSVALAVPKDPAFPEEIEDACAFDEAAGLVAVVDGASTGFDPVGWSRTIAQAALDTAPHSGNIDMAEIARRARSAWGEREAPNLPPGIRAKPTGATLGVIRVRRAGSQRHLTAQFIGDVSLLVYRAGHTPLLAADLAIGSSYTSSPETLNTDERETIVVRHLTGLTLLSGDVVLVYTDGFGKWLAERAGCPGVIDHLLSIDARSFIELVRLEQHAHRMELDDVMVVRSIIT